MSGRNSWGNMAAGLDLDAEVAELRGDSGRARRLAAAAAEAVQFAQKAAEPTWALERYEDGRQGFYPATEKEADLLRKLSVGDRRVYTDLRHAGKSVEEATIEMGTEL